MKKLRQIQFSSTAPMVWATYLDNFAKNDLDIKITRTTSSDQLGKGLADGAWDIGLGVMDNVIGWNASHGADLVMIAQLEDTLEMSFCAHADIIDLATAAAQPIAVDATASGFVLVLYRALARAGIDPRTCQFESVGGVKDRFDALLAGTAVSTILIPPFDALASEQGCKVLWRSSTVAPHYPGQVVVARRQWVTSHRDLVQSYLRALVMANRWAGQRANRHNAERALTNAGYTPATAARLVQHLVPDLRLSLPGWVETKALRSECGLLPDDMQGDGHLLHETVLETVIDSLN